MTAPRPTLSRGASPRLVAYGVVTVVGLFAAVVAGRAELAALAAPFALVFVAGVVLAETPVIAAGSARPPTGCLKATPSPPSWWCRRPPGCGSRCSCP